MKTKIMLYVLLCFSISNVMAGNYLEAMQANIKAIYEAEDADAFQKCINAFQRIASAEKDKWEPFYYIGFGNLMIANAENDPKKKDAYLDLAAEAIKKAKELAPRESEIMALEGFVLMLRVAVDPQSRGMQYAPLATQSLQTAVAINPENPRALALLAQMEFGSAKFFGLSTDEACGKNTKAAEQLKVYKSDNPLAPTWGKGMIESLSENCK